MKSKHPYVDTPSAGAPSNLFRRLASLVLLGAAGAYLAHYLYNSRGLLAEAVQALQVAGVVTATLLGVAMVALKSLYHSLTLHRLDCQCTATRLGTMRVVRAYALSQIVRYLPGKVLGIVYEAEALAGVVPLHRIVVANLVQYAYTNALSLGILASVGTWIFTESLGATLLVLAIALSLSLLCHRLSLMERAIAEAAALLPRLRELPRIVPDGGAYSTRATALLAAEWIPFMLFWWVLLPPGDSSLATAVVVGASYAAASLLANLTLVMPSGLVVREALFLWIGTQLSLDAAALMVLGLLARLLLTIADLALAPLTITMDSIFSNNDHD